MKRSVTATTILLLLALWNYGLHAQSNIVYPANSGVINVKNAPYYAKGDGVTDDTQAIQAALSSGVGGHAVVYLPEGTSL